MQALRIVLLAIAASIVYGIVHDQVTTRICIEYFTIGHPPLIDTESPTLLGLAWGVVATWWVGLGFGLVLALSARAGRRPKRTSSSLVRPIVLLLCITGLIAIAAGVLGHVLAKSGDVVLLEPLRSSVPPDRHVPFLTALWAHSASYWVGSIGAIVLAVVVWRSRRPTEIASDQPESAHAVT